MHFSEFCYNCEKISSSPKSIKQELLKKFFHECKLSIEKGASFCMFSVMRLLLPHFDRSRSSYGIKEATIAKFYVKLFCLSKDSPDMVKLTTFRIPKSSRSFNQDFADIVYNILRRRCSNKPSLVTIEEINRCLDGLSKTDSKKTDNLKQLHPLFLKLCALEQKWLIRIILRNVKIIGLNEKTILSIFHPDAKELYDVCNDLERVCVSLPNPSNRNFGIGITLLKPFRPMLTDRMEVSKFITQMRNKPFYVESKLDGERIQIHKKGTRFAFFTRRGFDYTSFYGTNTSSGNFTPRFNDCFLQTVNNCILDGEMVAWSTSGSFVVSKGENVDVKTLSSNGVVIPCFFAFDILLLNDEELSHLPLKERLKILESTVNPKEGVIQFPTRKLITNKAEVMDALNEAVDQREEGIVIKNPDSIYKPNERKGGWVKVKPEYVNSMMDHLDLIVLGGYYGQGRRKDLISMFLVGTAVSLKESDKYPREFFPLTRVGSGYSDIQLFELLRKLNPHWKKWDNNNPPSMIHCGREKPHVWIEPAQSVILEVKASEIVLSSAYEAGMTLRFPRVVQVRQDKAWYSAMSLSELKDMRTMSSGKLARRHSSIYDDMPNPKRIRSVKVASNHDGVATPFLSADTTDIERKSDCLREREICVLNGTESLPKQELEKKIVSGGGRVVQYPGNSTFCVVAAKEDIRVKSLRLREKWDIIRPQWILRCLTLNRFLPYRPEDVVAVNQNTKEKMEEMYDKFGNSLFEKTSVNDIPSILQRVKPLETPLLSITEIAELEYGIFGQVHKYGIFRTCIVYVDLWETISDTTSRIISGKLEIITLDLRMYGSEVMNCLSSKISHIVCDSAAHPHRAAQWRSRNHDREVKFHVVRPDWVVDSINKGFLVDERAYGI